jgi:uncharacterized protein YegJ (DUF2314 family)
MANMKVGDRVAFAINDTIDWSYMDGNRKIGNFTAACF